MDLEPLFDVHVRAIAGAFMIIGGSALLYGRARRAVGTLALLCMVASVFAGCGGNSEGTSPQQGIGPNGGAVTLLKFGVFGDSRPAHLNTPASDFPSAVVTNIVAGMTAKGVQIIFGLGDWQNCDRSGECSIGDLAALLAAESAGGFKGTILNLMGNHECASGHDEAECPLENETENVVQYMKMLLAPVGKSHSYFDLNVQTSLGKAHFIVTSPSAWSDNQQSWLNGASAQPADYTFYFQHQPQADPSSPGAKPAYDTMKAANPNTTLYIYSHVHEYMHFAGINEFIIGNGGAPSPPWYGYAIVEQLSSGNIQVTVYQATGTGSDPQMDQWAVSPQGQLLQPILP